jgi:hypothetical protein
VGMFGPNRVEVTKESIKLHKEEFNNLYSSPNNFRVIKSRRIRWAGMKRVLGRVEAAFTSRPFS